MWQAGKSCIEHFVMAGKRCRRIAIKGRANRRREFGEIDILGMHDAVFYREVMHERSKQGIEHEWFWRALRGLISPGLSRRHRAAGTRRILLGQIAWVRGLFFSPWCSDDRRRVQGGGVGRRFERAPPPAGGERKGESCEQNGHAKFRGG
jgi:hypothetical protein